MWGQHRKARQLFKKCHRPDRAGRRLHEERQTFSADGRRMMTFLQGPEERRRHRRVLPAADLFAVTAGSVGRILNIGGGGAGVQLRPAAGCPPGPPPPGHFVSRRPPAEGPPGADPGGAPARQHVRDQPDGGPPLPGGIRTAHGRAAARGDRPDRRPRAPKCASFCPGGRVDAEPPALGRLLRLRGYHQPQSRRRSIQPISPLSCFTFTHPPRFSTVLKTTP